MHPPVFTSALDEPVGIVASVCQLDMQDICTERLE